MHTAVLLYLLGEHEWESILHKDVNICANVMENRTVPGWTTDSDSLTVCVGTCLKL